MIFLDNGAAAASLQNLAQNNVINATINLVSGNTNINAAAGTNLTLGGTITGTGKLTLATGAGSVTLAGTGAYTGGTEIDSGTVIIALLNGASTQINNAGVGVITLNGGTLSYSVASGTSTAPAGFVLNFGPNGGTLNVAGSGTTGKFQPAGTAGLLTGSGTFTKTGGGDLQIRCPQPRVHR